jgi:hypothetical protein
MNDMEKTDDPLGIRPYGEARKSNAESIKISVESVVKYINHICEPAAKEIGLILGDQFSYWRQSRAVALNEKLKQKLVIRKERLEDLHAPPRIVMKIFEEGSTVDDDEIQDMWAGLLASSCTEDGKDDSNLIFINILSQMTAPEARIVNFTCQSCIWSYGGLSRMSINVPDENLQKIARLYDTSLLLRELAHLGSLGLIILTYEQGPKDKIETFHIEPQDAAYHLYARCQGHVGPLREFAEAQKRKPL